ncbi:Tetratricopeptide repeat-containing protein [Candidatus Electrothrix laxa]
MNTPGKGTSYRTNDAGIKRGTQGGRRYRTSWFDRQRNFFLRQFFADFFTLTYSFQKLYRAYCDCRGSAMGSSCYLLHHQGKNAHCRIWDQLNWMIGEETDKGPLWNLRELCRRVWPEGEHEENVEGSLVDWLMGSIFHEAIRLREDVHILNNYGNATFKNRQITAARANGSHLQNLPASRLAKVMDRKNLIKRVAVDVMQQMEQLAFLFGQTNNMLRTMLSGLADNFLLVRFLVEQEDIVEDLWGEALVDVFADMFSGTPARGFCAAGSSYMSGQWYTRALIMYKRALEFDEGCDQAGKKVQELQLLIHKNSAFLGAA